MHAWQRERTRVHIGGANCWREQLSRHHRLQPRMAGDVVVVVAWLQAAQPLLNLGVPLLGPLSHGGNHLA